MRPVNVASKRVYRGVNVLTLWATADENGLLQARPSWSPTEKGSPFRGLEAFDVAHERIMSGTSRQPVAQTALKCAETGSVR
jgi:hypothetical protein